MKAHLLGSATLQLIFSGGLPALINLEPGEFDDCFLRPLPFDVPGMVESSFCDQVTCVAGCVMEARIASHHVEVQSLFCMLRDLYT